VVAAEVTREHFGESIARIAMGEYVQLDLKPTFLNIRSCMRFGGTEDYKQFETENPSIPLEKFALSDDSKAYFLLDERQISIDINSETGQTGDDKIQASLGTGQFTITDIGSGVEPLSDIDDPRETLSLVNIQMQLYSPNDTSRMNSPWDSTYNNFSKLLAVGIDDPSKLVTTIHHAVHKPAQASDEYLNVWRSMRGRYSRETRGVLMSGPNFKGIQT